MIDIKDFSTQVYGPCIVNVRGIKESLETLIKSDRRDPILSKNDIWYEWNGRMEQVHAIDTKDLKDHQLENYTYMGYWIDEKRPIKFGKLDCNLIILKKDSEFEPEYKMDGPGFKGFSLAIGYDKDTYEHVILEVPHK